MMIKRLTIVLIPLVFDLSNQQQWDTTEITDYNFHTYFFQNNIESEKEAWTLRETIQELSETVLKGCRLSNMNYAPIGPHLIGSYETCCNASSLSRAQSFFMQNHGKLSILLHPLTRYEVLDHTTRAMWLGNDIPLDISTLNEDLGPAFHDEAKCMPINLNQAGTANSSKPSLLKTLFVFTVFVVSRKLV